MARICFTRIGLAVAVGMLSRSAFGAPAIMTPMTGSAETVLQNSAAPKEAINVAASEPRVYPNPWRSDRMGNSSITFDRLPSDSTVKIFTLAGREVRTLDA